MYNGVNSKIIDDHIKHMAKKIQEINESVKQQTEEMYIKIRPQPQPEIKEK